MNSGVMKIGIMARHLAERGGIGVYSNNLLKALFQIDQHNEYVLLHRDQQSVGRFTDIPNMTEKILPARHKILWDQVAVAKFSNQANLDIVFNPKLSIPLRTRAKTVLVMHGAEQFAVPKAFKFFDRMYFTLANPRYCRAASAIIAMTHIGAKDISRYMRADPEKIHVIPEAYNELCRVMSTEETEPLRQKYKLPQRFILFIGGLNPIKNLGNALRAFAKIKDGPHDMVILGFKRWKFEKDLRLLEELGLKSRVHFAGFVPDEDIPAFYNMAELYLFPSLYEGFGIPVLEAMACGCPVVTSQTGCSPEVAGNAAVLVDPYKPDSIHEGVNQVLQNQSLRDELIEKGLRRCMDFSWKKTALATRSLFESLAEQSS